MTVEFRPSKGEPGLVVVDHIEGRRFPLVTNDPVSLGDGSTDRFGEPVDSAVSCRTASVSLPYVVPVFVRDGSGELVAECNDFADRSLPGGEYEIEIAAPIKVFLRVSSRVRVTSTSDEMTISFERITAVDFAARSFHERPAATVTTTAEPADLMRAVSTFGSALKTTSPERSLPSLRGHPPTIRLGERLEVPDGISRPETGLRIEVPADRTAVYAVATLAHYLGAEVVPADAARLVADGDVVRTLDGPNGLGANVTETLQQVVLLDCIVRTVGRYPLDLHERRELAERRDLPLEELYDAPIAERVARYLEIPFETLSDLVPRWYLSTHLSPDPQSAEVLPYAANALSLVGVERQNPVDRRSSSPPGYDGFVRATSSADEPPGTLEDRTYVRVSETDALERAWFGTGRAINANDLYLTGITNRFQPRSTDGPIDICVVCNDERMTAEVDDGDLYGDRDELPFDVTVHRDLSCAELRTLLTRELDFFHYIGHVERAGFVCRDGALDAADLEAIGVDTFLLNGCRSYDQGRAMIDRGSIGGIVTYGAVDNTNATVVGQTVAGLLNAGYSLRSALSVTGYQHRVNARYSVVGDGAVQVAQSESGTPNLFTISRASDEEGYEVSIATFPALGTAMGACYTPYAPSADRYYLTGGTLPSVVLSFPEVVNLLSLERVPTIIDEEFRWSTDVSPVDLP